ncbi:hypothetical protein EVA_18955, partial [gut metagenome]
NIFIVDNKFRNIKKRAVWCLNYVDSKVENNIMEKVGGGHLHPRHVQPQYKRWADRTSG